MMVKGCSDMVALPVGGLFLFCPQKLVRQREYRSRSLGNDVDWDKLSGKRTNIQPFMFFALCFFFFKVGTFPACRQHSEAQPMNICQVLEVH